MIFSRTTTTDDRFVCVCVCVGREWMKRKVLFSVVRYPCRQCILLRVLTKLSMASHSSRGKSNHREPSPGFRLFEYNSVTSASSHSFSVQRTKMSDKNTFFFCFFGHSSESANKIQRKCLFYWWIKYVSDLVFCMLRTSTNFACVHNNGNRFN